MGTATGNLYSWQCGGNQDRCYGGIAAEIGTKNMPPACFLNAPTAKSDHIGMQKNSGILRFLQKKPQIFVKIVTVVFVEGTAKTGYNQIT